MLRAALAGRHVLVTGVTGFVGQALLERLLVDFPDTRVSVLVRPAGGSEPAARLQGLLGRPAFARLAGQGGSPTRAPDRLTVVAGDLAEPIRLPEPPDLVIHCASDVSFDPPVDEGFDANVHGTVRLLDAVTAHGARPHYLHVSTAYVAGLRRGDVAEERLAHDVDWRGEAAAAARLRERAEDESRAPGVLSRLRRAAEHEFSRAGPLSTAGDAERRRRNWVRDRLVAAGSERARSLGWTDTYTYTKAMAERAVEELARQLPVTVVRPSIIESALHRPQPGWIEGFKMAEPLILAFGRGELTEFSASPDATFDVVPVDYVVNALLAAAASPPAAGQPSYLHVCSGARNPVTYRRLYELVRGYFERHPMEQAGRGAAPLPTWEWPGSATVERVLRAGERAQALADGVVARLPRSPRVRELARDLDRRGRRLDFLRRYHDLYRPYVESELRFDDRRALALHRSLSPDDRGLFGFDTADIDWAHYLGEVHCPAVTAPMRAATARRRPVTGRAPAGLPARSDVLAVFDMDGTVVASNVIESYLWLRLPELGWAERARELRTLGRRLPGYLATERRDRGAFLRAVYRRYRGADLAGLARLVDDEVADLVLHRASAAALRRVREHRAAGHRTVLVTGGIRPLTRPLAPLFDTVVAAELQVDDDGRCTGFLTAPPLVGEGRAAWLRRFAAGAGLDLASCYGYADSHTDLPLLRAVGHPVAVNPDVALFRAARRARWPVAEWPATGRADLVALPGGAARRPRPASFGGPVTVGRRGG